MHLEYPRQRIDITGIFFGFSVNTNVGDVFLKNQSLSFKVRKFKAALTRLGVSKHERVSFIPTSPQDEYEI